MGTGRSPRLFLRSGTHVVRTVFLDFPTSLPDTAAPGKNGLARLIFVSELRTL